METTTEIKNIEKRAIKWIEELFKLSNPVEVIIDNHSVFLAYDPDNADVDKDESVDYYEEGEGVWIILTKKGDSIIIAEIIGLNQIP